MNMQLYSAKEREKSLFISYVFVIFLLHNFSCHCHSMLLVKVILILTFILSFFCSNPQCVAMSLVVNNLLTFHCLFIKVLISQIQLMCCNYILCCFAVQLQQCDASLSLLYQSAKKQV